MPSGTSTGWHALCMHQPIPNPTIQAFTHQKHQLGADPKPQHAPCQGEENATAPPTMPVATPCATVSATRRPGPVRLASAAAPAWPAGGRCTSTTPPVRSAHAWRSSETAGGLPCRQQAEAVDRQAD